MARPGKSTRLNTTASTTPAGTRYPSIASGWSEAVANEAMPPIVVSAVITIGRPEWPSECTTASARVEPSRIALKNIDRKCTG